MFRALVAILDENGNGCSMNKIPGILISSHPAETALLVKYCGSWKVPMGLNIAHEQLLLVSWNDGLLKYRNLCLNGEGAGEWSRQLPCDVDYSSHINDNDRHEKHTTLYHKKAKTKMHHQQICDTMHTNKDLSYWANKGRNAKSSQPHPSLNWGILQ